MGIYDSDGTVLNKAYDSDGSELLYAYDANGNVIYSADQQSVVDYTNYSYTEKWASKGIGNTQGFFIYDDKVYWVSKSGDSSASANCYVWNLIDGSQVFETQPITIYSGHGNSLDIAYPKVYAGTAYSPATVYENILSSELNSFTLSKKFDVSEDASYGHDVCVAEHNPSIIWTLAHAGAISETSAPFLISKWNVNDLTDNGDGTYSPRLIQSVETPQPSNSPYFQGMNMHDGILWYACGYPGNRAFVYGVNPNTGEVLYSIDCNTTAEPEGVAFYPDEEAVGGYAMYVGFQGMVLRKYTFGTVSNS